MLTLSVTEATMLKQIWQKRMQKKSEEKLKNRIQKSIPNNNLRLPSNRQAEVLLLAVENDSIIPMQAI